MSDSEFSNVNEDVDLHNFFLTFAEEVLIPGDSDMIVSPNLEDIVGDIEFDEHDYTVKYYSEGITETNLAEDGERFQYIVDDDENDEQLCDDVAPSTSSNVATSSDDFWNTKLYGKNNLEWKMTLPKTNVRKKSANIHRKFTSLTESSSNCNDHLESFLIFFSFIDEIVQCTNIFIRSIRSKFERERDCNETDSIEIQALLGLLYLIGSSRHSKTNVQDIWDKRMGIPYIHSTMNYKRFLFLMRCLRFDDINTREVRRREDKLAAIRSIYTQFNYNLQNNFTCGVTLCVDERLEKFYGRSPFTLYIPSKPARYGIKQFALVDCQTKYTSKLEIYCGLQKDSKLFFMDENHNSAFNVVKRLTSHVVGASRNVTMDNWFTSYPLLTYLLENKTTIVGSMRRNNAEIPPEMLQSNGRDINSNLFLFRKECVLLSKLTKKKKCLILISSLHKDNKMTEKEGLSEIHDFYNKTKNAVDVTDQYCSSFNVARRCKRWPLVLFYSFMNIAAINARIILHLNNKGFDLKDRKIFIQELGYQLTKPYAIRRLQTQNLPRELKRRIADCIPNQESEDFSQNKQKIMKFDKPKRCYICVGQDKKTSLGCSFCYKPICREHNVNVCQSCLEEKTSISH